MPTINNVITKDVVIKVKKDDVKLSQTPYVFKGDKGMIFQITVQNWNYYFDQNPSAEVDIFTNCNARIGIIKPDNNLLKITDVPIKDNEINFKINENLSQLVGEYKVFVEILKGDDVVATIPPFTYLVLDKPNFANVLPSDMGFIQAQVSAEDNPLLCYNTIDDFGIRKISELPKTKTQTDKDEILIQANGLTKTILIGDFLRTTRDNVNKYADDLATAIRGEVATLNTELGKTKTELKGYSDTNLQSAKDYTNAEIGKITGNSNSNLAEAKKYTDDKLVEGKSYTDQKIKDVVGLAPPELDTLKEIGDFATANKSLIDGFVAQLGNKSDVGHRHDNVTELVDGFMSKEDFTKLKGIAVGANNYSHPKTHQASIIIQDATHRFVTDEDKSKWNKIYPYNDETTLDANNHRTNGFIKTSSETLNLPQQCENPTDKWGTLQFIRENSGITGTQIFRPVDGTQKGETFVRSLLNDEWGVWKKLTTFSGDYNDLTNKPTPYTLPIASNTVLGGIKLGVGFEAQVDGTVNVVSGGKADSVDWTGILNKPSEFNPTIATTTRLGGIKVGDGLSVGADGTLSANVKQIDWGGIQNKPSNFTPSTHAHNKAEILDLFGVENSLTSNSTVNAISVSQAKVIDDKVNVLRGEFDTTKVKVNSIDTDVINLKTKSTELETSIGNLSTNVGTLNTDVGKLKNDIGTLNTNTHTHANKTELDKITMGKVNEWDSKASGTHTHTLTDINNMFIVEDSLTSTSTINALSSKQGKVLNDKIVQLQQGINGVHTHNNKATLDKITEQNLTDWSAKETTTGSQAKADKALQDAKAYADSKVNVGNKTFKAYVSNWVYQTDTTMYKASVTHNLNTENIIVVFTDAYTKESILASYKVLNTNSIEIINNTNTNIYATIIDAEIKTVGTGGGNIINDNTSSTTTTYSSKKIDDLIKNNTGTGGTTTTPNYKNYKIEYNATRDSLDFVYSPIA